MKRGGSPATESRFFPRAISTPVLGSVFCPRKNMITKEEFRAVFFELNGGVKTREKLFDSDPEAAADLLGDRLLKDHVDDFSTTRKRS